MKACIQLALAGFSLALAACGGGSGGAFLGAPNGGTVATEDLEIHLAGADTAVVGVIDIQNATVPGNGSTAIGVRLLDQNGNAYTATAPSVNFFTTECSNTSEFSEPGGVAANAFTPNAAGVIRLNWTDKGCNTGNANKAVTLRAALDDAGTQRTATGNLTLEPVTVGSVLNESPLSPVVISLNNQGTTERPDFQVLQFKVVSNSNNPVAGKTVCFDLSVAPDGTTLTANSAVSDANGIVTTTVESGSVSGSVIVRASDLNGRANCGIAEPANTDFASNSQVVISSGLAVQDRFSLSAETLNIEGFDITGTTTNIRVDAADVFSNPIKAGESVVFQSSGASVTSPCEPVKGTCAATFKSQDSRPTNGRVVIMARIKGEEGFDDENGNGRFDDVEFDTVTEPGEAFIDANENGVHDAGEVFIDETPTNSARDAGDGDYNGSTCVPNGARCSAKQSINVWKSVTVVLARSEAQITITPNPINIPDEGSVQVTIEVAGVMPDSSEQKMPSGTSVAASTTVGNFVGNSTFTVPNTNAPGGSIFTATVSDSGDAANGLFTVKVTSPSGVESFASVPISQP